jgi:hypothetical protein
MIKFRLIFDWYVDDFFEKVKIYEAGHVFSPCEDDNLEGQGKYIIENPINKGRMVMNIEQMRNAKNGSVLMFEEVEEQEINMTIEEVTEDKDNEVRNWRIQLDVKTSLKNLKLIETFIKENIQELL